MKDYIIMCKCQSFQFPLVDFPIIFVFNCNKAFNIILNIDTLNEELLFLPRCFLNRLFSLPIEELCDGVMLLALLNSDAVVSSNIKDFRLSTTELLRCKTVLLRSFKALKVC